MRRQVQKTLRVLGCFALFFAGDSSFVATRSRNLELECPASLDDPRDDEPETSRSRFSAYSQGQRGTGMIAKLRGKSSSFYENVVNNLIMASCDVETQSERCVEESSSLAAKDWTESCIVAADHACPPGTCERVSNCYWNSVASGQNRTTRFPPGDYAEAADSLIGLEQEGSYARGVVTFLLPGVVISIVAAVVWLVFFVARLCCCCLWTRCGLCFLCSPVPKPEGYRVLPQLVLPALVYIICVVGVAAGAGVAFIGNEDISIAASNTFHHASGMIQDLTDFLDRSRMPLENIEGIVQDAAVDARHIFNGTSYVKATALQIVSSFTDFGRLHTEGLETSTAQSGFDAALDGFNRQVTPVVDQVQGMLDTLEMDLYSNVDTIQSAIASAIDSVDSFNEQATVMLDEVHAIEGQEYSLRPIRLYAVLAVFLVALVVVVGGLLGISVSKTKKCHKLFHLLTIAGVLCAILGSVAFVVSSLSLAVSVVWYDVCEVSAIVTADFEPFLGDKVAAGANACFNDTNLAVAFNVTDKVDFQAKLDDGLAIIENVNITEKFDRVLSPLDDIQSLIERISTTALTVLNGATAIDSEACPFNDTYDKDTILSPWSAHDADDDDGGGGGRYTTWASRTTGAPASYGRLDENESGTEYVRRIYDAAGVCAGTGGSSSSCCLNGVCSGLNAGDACNGGSDCVYPCSALRDAIVAGYDATVEAYAIERRMTADLGVECPAEPDLGLPASSSSAAAAAAADVTCPTAEFRDLGNDVTLVALVDEYEVNITGTADDLVNLANTSVGMTMDEVKDLLCNMNASFVGSRYRRAEEEMCTRMLGGVAQVNWALWMLAICLELAAVLANVLSTRLRGLSRREADEIGSTFADDAAKHLSGRLSGRGSGMSRADLYGKA